jgi:hypothetical protein
MDASKAVTGWALASKLLKLSARLESTGSGQTRRGQRHARVRGLRALDVDCVPARAGISRTVRQRRQLVTLALGFRLAAFLD